MLTRLPGVRRSHAILAILFSTAVALSTTAASAQAGQFDATGDRTAPAARLTPWGFRVNYSVIRGNKTGTRPKSRYVFQ